jgi:hypothetical protein
VRVYRLRKDTERYLGLVPANPKDAGAFNMVSEGKPLAPGWVPFQVEFSRYQDRPDHREIGDMASFFDVVPIFSTRAVSVLHDILVAHGEILPLLSQDGDYFIFNLLTVVDAINWECSRIRKLPSGAIMDMGNTYAFHPEQLRNVHMFRPPQLKTVFVTDTFVQRVTQSGLTGFKFPLVWERRGLAQPETCQGTSQPPWNFVAAFFFVFTLFSPCWMVLGDLACEGRWPALVAADSP